MRFKVLVFAGLAAAAISMSGCETMSAEECAAADWRALGYQDAAQRGADRLPSRTESCAKKGMAADPEAYQSGFSEGLYVFCEPNRAFQFARNGGAFNGTCPGELAADFDLAFADGQRVRDAEFALQAARNEVSRLESRRRQLDEQIGSRERALAEATTQEERNRLEDEIGQRRRERRDANDDIRVAQARIPPLLVAVGIMRAEIGNRWGAWY